MPTCAPKHSETVTVEPLERRRMLAISVGDGGVVFVAGDAAKNDLIVRLRPRDRSMIEVYDGQTLAAFELSTVQAVSARGFAGDDRLFIDNRFGFVAARGAGISIRFDGDEGSDRVVLSGDPRGATLRGTYVPGDATGAGEAGAGTITTRDARRNKQTVFFFGAEDVVDLTPAYGLTVSTNERDNAVQVLNGPRSRDGSATGRVNVFDVELCPDDEAHEDRDIREAILHAAYAPILFANKRALTVTTLGGDDVLELNLPARPSALRDINFDGGNGADELLFDRAARKLSTDRDDVEDRSNSLALSLVVECTAEPIDDDHDHDGDDDDDDDDDD